MILDLEKKNLSFFLAPVLDRERLACSIFLINQPLGLVREAETSLSATILLKKACCYA